MSSGAPMRTDPGQYVIKKEDAAAETKTPWQQIKLLRRYVVLAYLGLTACLVAIGKFVFVLLGLGLAVLMAWVAWKRTGLRAMAVIILLVIGTPVLVCGPPLLAERWPSTFTLALLTTGFFRWVLTVWAIGFIVCWALIPAAFGVVRFGSEIIDPNGPTAPRTAIGWPGTIWPWQAGHIFKAMNPPEVEQVPAQLQMRTQVDVGYRTPNGYNRRDIVSFSVEPETMQVVARRILSGGTFSERGMAGEGRPLSGRDEFNAVRDEFIARGLACWKNEEHRNQGIEFTQVGLQVLRHLARDGTEFSPYPAEKST